MNLSANQLKALINTKLSHHFGLSPEDSDDEHVYKAVVLVVRDMLLDARHKFSEEMLRKNGKRVYYLCMEFLMGRSLRNNLYNLGIEKVVAKVLPEYHTTIAKIYDMEPDAGLGNGGLGRLAACFLDGLATEGYFGMGYCLKYEYGIFEQKIVDGWQTELPEFWLPGGETWMIAHREDALDIKFGGRVQESWNDGYHSVEHVDYQVIKAVPYDMMCAGLDGKGVSTLRLWSAECREFDMKSFNEGDYLRSIEENAMAQMLTKVLYPGDNHMEGKSLRLSQQYFLVSSSIQDIVKRHLRHYRTLENFADVVSIHINDTHPALAIPEFMRVLMDECGYEWDKAWATTTKVMAYTNHTVMQEALECWGLELFSSRLPRIFQIVCEINRRFCEEMNSRSNGDYDKVHRMSIINDGFVKMANLCIAGSHSVNGVSALHSEIIKQSVFSDFYSLTPDKFTNVTNGIAHRRWLCQSNPRLTSLISGLIGDKFVKDAFELQGLTAYRDDDRVLSDLAGVKRENKVDLSNYIAKKNGIMVDPDSLFDVQVKRLHEYKRQHLNALHILAQYQWILDNPNAPFVPKTYIFGAKAASGYFMAKQIIRFICSLADVINNDKRIEGKLKVVFLENYRVTVAEMLMPASEISEQISLAGTEASGTGNMKFMLNGAVTLGTEDGANVEIHEAVGDDNIFIFGMSTPEAKLLKQNYQPSVYYNNNPVLRRAIDALGHGFKGHQFGDIANNLLTSDPYMVMADFADYCRAEDAASAAYTDKLRWNSMSLVNIANSGIFSADRAINDYAGKIWHATALPAMKTGKK
ncbi:MAG: glycogen/starch/alpha-glucan phosphorylase [Oscillospiraceae bacterium]|jgi:starch phosphorylase|nr:glycogen/starch/alpha-glucan phosphorylase [Oscillospiraceae bacterium]